MLCIDISENELIWELYSYSERIPVVKSRECIPLPSGVIRDGRIADFTYLKRVLRDSVKKSRLEKCLVATALPLSQVICHPIVFPVYLTPEEYETEIKLFPEKYVGAFALDVDIVVDCYIEKKEQNGQYGWMVATKRERVNTYLTLLKNVGLYPYLLEVTIHAVMRALTSLVSFDHDEMILLERAVCQGTLDFLEASNDSLALSYSLSHFLNRQIVIPTMTNSLICLGLAMRGCTL